MSDPLALALNDSVPFVPLVDRHQGCGGIFAATTISKSESMCGLTATVERRVMRCNRCGIERRAPDQVEADYLGTMAAIRESHGLLTPSEIRRIRDALGVTHDEFDALLGLPSGISKGWEVQRHLQNKMADERIRALQDVEHAKGIAAAARVTLRLTEEERAAFRPPSFLRRKGGAAISAEATEAEGTEPQEPVAPSPERVAVRTAATDAEAASRQA